MIYLGDEIDALENAKEMCIDKLFDFEEDCEESKELAKQISDIEKAILIFIEYYG